MRWHELKISKPEPYTEVLVWVDGKRGPSWKDNHALVAYMTPDGKWYEERHHEDGSLGGVYLWAPIEDPDEKT